MSKVLAVLAIGAGLVSPLALPAAAGAGGDYNGTWSVELVTESGLCDSRYRYSVAVNDGQVRLVASADRATMSGRVGPDGTVGLSVSNGAASGAVSGRLQASSGGGTWKVSPLCSGRWTARRQAMRTAQAD
ncbi:hypothetical protein [Methylobacterium iners]|uniref:Large exoprotein involved in heme utilization or adhesion n=1 Tax=Methylobacterium iners TaxID=418707 RepID=A0ABQ4S1U3_9HYPH|nr:hypothetical protein [Methylobacterium iners]GJD97029.1 hypothetical protein OCOJLMKI_4257 [Methylobacterium iners]